MKRYRKYIRYFFIEPRIRIAAMICLLLLVVLFILGRFLAYQDKRIADVMGERDLVQRIGYFEQEIAKKTPLPEKPKEPPKPKEINYTLQGTGVVEGVPYAVINGIHCNMGDIIGNYLILDIALDKVTLRNNRTIEIMELRFNDSGVTEKFGGQGIRIEELPTMR